MDRPPRTVSRRPSLAALAALTGLAAPLAHAQTARIDNMPDFDQVRAMLPGNGGYHCVPTACVNLMAFIANNGFPGMMDGPRNWQAQSNHNFVSGNIFVMGLLQGTVFPGGTDGNGWETGLRQWVDDHAPGLFTVTRVSVTPTFHAANPQTIYSAMHDGSLVVIAYGRYTRPFKFEPPYERSGGHAVTPTLITLAPTPDHGHTVQYRDPATDDNSLTTQSIFSTRVATFSLETIPLTDGSSSTMWEMHFEPPPPLVTRRFLDTVTIVTPAFVLTPTMNTVTLHRPFRLFNSNTPPVRAIPAPGALSVAHAEICPDQVSALVVTHPLPGGLARLWHLTLESGRYAELMAIPGSNTPIAVSRHTGEIYIPTVDNVLIRYTTQTGPNGNLMLVPQESHRVPSSIGAAVYDDDADGPVLLLPAVNQMLVYQRTLGEPIVRPMSGEFSLQGPLSIHPAPAGTPFEDDVFVRSGQNIYQFRLVSGVLRRVATITPGGGAITGVTMTDIGSLLIARGGSLVEYWHSPDAGGWIQRPDSMFNGLSATGPISVSRSRSNFDPALHDVPGWELIIDELEGVPEVPDCAADFNHDGLANSADFFDFLIAFFRQDHSADINFDGFINSQDFFDFLAVFFEGCE